MMKFLLLDTRAAVYITKEVALHPFSILIIASQIDQYLLEIWYNLFVLGSFVVLLNYMIMRKIVSWFVCGIT